MKCNEYIAAKEMQNELNVVQVLAEQWLGCVVSVEQTDEEISPLVFLQCTRGGVRFNYSVLWSKESLGVGEYLSMFVTGDAQLLKTPPERWCPKELQKVFNIWVRNKFGNAECVLKVAAGLYE
jgi:hypothetical protein